MRFEYNTDLCFNERIEMVANEITDAYPMILKTEALTAAAHATPVDDKMTSDDKFDRYFFILKTIGRGHIGFYLVLSDAYNLFQRENLSGNYRDAMIKMISYANHEIDTMPDLFC